MPNSLQAIFSIILFFIPGYVATYFKNSIGYRKRQSDFERTLQSIFFSTLTYFFLFLILLPFHLIPHIKSTITAYPSSYLDFSEPQLLGVLGAFLLVNVAAIPIGMVFGRIERGASLHQYFQKQGWTNQDGHITQWDKIFVDSYPFWAQVKSSDGNIYQGRVVGASSYPEEKELVLTDVHYLTQEGEERKLEYEYLYLSGDDLNNMRFTVSLPVE